MLATRGAVVARLLVRPHSGWGTGIDIDSQPDRVTNTLGTTTADPALFDDLGDGAVAPLDVLSLPREELAGRTIARDTPAVIHVPPVYQMYQEEAGFRLARPCES